MSVPPPCISILLVDDSIDMLQLLTDLLEREGYRVRAVASSAGALRTLVHEVPDLILLDINMPEMDGIELCRRMRERVSLDGVPVIVLSGRAATMDKLEAFQAGAVDFITKPFEHTELLIRVRTQLELCDLRRRLERQNAALAANLRRSEKLERLRDQLVHMVAHDMRSPLSVISGTVHFMRQRPPEQASASLGEDLARLSRASRALNGLIADFLDVSRLEEERLPLQLRAESPGLLLDGALSDLRKVAAQDLCVAAEPTLPAVLCDRSLILRVVRNLVENALKYSSPATPVFVRAAAHPFGVRFEVQDRGPGIPVEQREAVFKKFAVGGRPARSGSSTGLGLAFCKLAVEAHGGRIAVESTADQGCMFWFTLPGVERGHVREHAGSAV